MTIAVPVGTVLWTTWTHELHYNVYSDDIYWYREDFPTYFNLIVTAVLSLVLGLIAFRSFGLYGDLRQSSLPDKQERKQGNVQQRLAETASRPESW